MCSQMKAVVKKKGVEGMQGFNAEDFSKFAAGIADEAKGWCKFALFDEPVYVQSSIGGGSGSGGSGRTTASFSIEDAMKRAQEAYDSCTRTMSSIRTASRELLLLVPPGSLQASATKACVVQAREMEPHSAKLEDILFAEIKCDIHQIEKILQEAAPVYIKLAQSEQELVEITQNEMKKAKRAKAATS